MTKVKKEIISLALASILATFIVWLPFIFGSNGGMLTVFKNYDGPNYLVVTKSWYDKTFISSRFSLPLPAEYYPAHLPGYPFIISILDIFLPGPWAMLVSTLIFSVFCSLVFYLFLLKFKLSENPFWLSLIFLALPARWTAVKAVGSPEPLFIFAILASFYFFKSEKYWLAGIFGALAQVTKSPGILLFAGYSIYLFKDIKSVGDFGEKFKKIVPLLLIPLSALAVFLFYQIRTGDFLAYFHSGDNFHLVFSPYQSFSQNRSWLGDFWREDMVWQYLLGALAVIFLFKQKFYDLAGFAGIFFAATLFVAHRDLARYSLPLIPFSLIAFDKFLQKREFKIALLIILPAIYLYAINFISHNTAPVADWSPYL